jgi:D-alanyl-D-alanine carboxypeptidase (penicillin-binding protein 5/6)
MGRGPNVCGDPCPIIWAVVLTALVAARLLTGVSGARAEGISRHQPIAPPPVSADAVLVTDITSGTDLFALNPDTPLPPASLTKIVSALVVLEHANPDDVVTIEEADRVDPDESQVGLVVGDRLTVRDLFVGMLVPSGNDATLALARHVGEATLGVSGSAKDAVAEFVALMNDKARELGAGTATFKNPTGIDADGHEMSARDVEIVTAAALQNPLFAETVSTTRATLASAVLADGYPVRTTNLLLLEGAVNGVKTGTTPNAGGCLVTSYAVGPNNVVAVVLGSDATEAVEGQPDATARFDETRLLLDAVAADFVWLDPSAPGAVDGLLDELRVWDVGLSGHNLLPVPAREVADVRYRLVLGPPSAGTDAAGEIRFYVGDALLAEQPALQAS